MAPVGLIELDAVPGSFRFAQELAQAFTLIFGVERTQQSPSDKHGHEPVQVGMLSRASVQSNQLVSLS